MTKGICIICKKPALYGLKGKYCGDHRQFSQKCLFKGGGKCMGKRIFGKEGGKATRCKDHKKSNHIRIKNIHQNCKYKREKCYKRAVYNKKGEKKGLFCFDHKEDGMENVVTKKCISCKVKVPTYSKLGMRTKLYCEDCVPNKTEYKSVSKVECFAPNCERNPSHALKGQKTRVACDDHFDPVIHEKRKFHKICDVDGCELTKSFGQVGTKIKEFCSEHAKEAELKTGILYREVSKKLCIHEETNGDKCYKYATYGDETDRIKKYCGDHIPDDDCKYINLGSKRICIHVSKTGEKCTTECRFGYSGYPPEFCGSHQLPRMVKNPKNKEKEKVIICEYCATEIHYNETFCSGCKKYLELGTTVKYRQKELTVKALLEENDIKFIHNSKVEDGCSRFRPDFRIPTPYGNIILEVDEFQHSKSYDCQCEINRMGQIYFDCGLPYVLFIRYNPDSYKEIGNEKNFSSERRQEYLLKFLKENLGKDIAYPKNRADVVYLFYDWFIPDEPEVETVLIADF